MAEDSKRFGIYIKTQFDGKGFDEADKRGVDSAKTAGDNAKKMSDEYRNAFDGIGKAATVAFAAVAAGIGFSVREFGKQEDALNRARSAVEITGKSWSEFSGKVNASATSLQQFTRYGDDEAIGMFADMVLLSGNAAASLENMGLAADVAAGLHMDLGSASRYLGMALAGETVMLSRYVPSLRTMKDVLGENATQQEKARFITEKLRQSFGGLAQREAQTMTGSIKQAANAAGDAAEELGSAFAPELKKAAIEAKGAAEATGEWIKNHQTLVRVMGEFALSATGWIAATAGITLAIAKLPAAITAVGQAYIWLAANPAGAIIASLGAVALAAYRVNAALLELSQGGKGVDTWGKYARAMDDAVESASDLRFILRQVNTIADEHGISANLAGKQILDLYKQYGNIVQATNVWMYSLQGANTALDTHAEKVQVNASALRDLMNAGLSAAEALKMAATMPVLGEQGIEGGGRSRLDTELTMLQEHNAAKLENDKQSAAERVRIWSESYQQNYQNYMNASQSIQAASGQFMGSLLNTEMTGTQRMQMFWNTLASGVLGQINSMLWGHIAAKAAERAATSAAAAAGAAATAGEAAIEKPIAASMAASWMSVAYAKALAFFAFSGPVAPGLAAAVTGAGMGAMAGQGAAAGALVLGFAQGGIVPGNGYQDSVPAMLTPGERVISREVYRERRTEIENAISGRGGNTINVTVNADRRLSLADTLDIERMIESRLPRIIEEFIENRMFRSGLAFAK